MNQVTSSNIFSQLSPQDQILIDAILLDDLHKNLLASVVLLESHRDTAEEEKYLVRFNQEKAALASVLGGENNEDFRVDLLALQGTWHRFIYYRKWLPGVEIDQALIEQAPAIYDQEKTEVKALLQKTS